MSGFLSTMVGVSPSAPAVSYPQGVTTVSSNFIHPYSDYTQSNVVYVGPDSSNRPVFATASGSSNNLRVLLFRYNSDNTITEGSNVTKSLTGIIQQVALASEYEDANSFGAGSGDYIYMTYQNSSASYAIAASVDRNNLTCTLGTEVNLSMTPDATQVYCAYVGNSRSVHGVRTGSGASVKRYSRTGTSLSVEGTTGSDMSFRIDSNNLMAFANNGSTQYRYGWWATAGGASGTVYGAGALGSSNYFATNTSIASSNYNVGNPLNNSGKMIGLNQLSGVYYMRAVSITWNASSAPTMSAGSTVNFNDVTGSGGQVYVCSGHEADEAYAVYAGSSSTIDYRKITASGTTLTLNSKVTGINTGVSSLYYQLAATPATIGTAKYLAGFYVRSSGNPYLWCIRLA